MTNDTQISDRELEILRLVATGATNQQIADQLSISVNTVKVHLRNIFGKIGAVSRTEATVYAIRNGLVPGIGLAAEPLAAPEADAEQLAPPADLPHAPPAPIPAPPATPSTAIAQPPGPQAPPRPGSRLVWLGGGLVAILAAAAILWLARGGQATPGTDATTSAAATAPAEPAGRWLDHAPLPRPRDSFALAAFDPEGRLFVIGGREGGQAVALLDRYDPETGLWVSLADKPTAVSEAQAIALRGKIYVPGGEAGDGRPATVFEAYDPQEQSWQALAPLPEPRSRYALAVWEGRIYLLGGWDGGRLSDTVFVYDPLADSWSRGEPLPTPRQHAGASVVAGQLYLVGGEGAEGPLREGLRLDPGGGRWEGIAPMPQAIPRPSSIAVINSLLVFDAAARVGWQYNATGDAWSRYEIPADAPLAPAAALLTTSIFFVADAAAPTPGAVGEYRVIYTIFVPARGE